MLQHICLPINSLQLRALQGVTQGIERVVKKSTFTDPVNATARTWDSGLNGAIIPARYRSHDWPAVTQVEDVGELHGVWEVAVVIRAKVGLKLSLCCEVQKSKALALGPLLRRSSF